MGLMLMTLGWQPAARPPASLPSQSELPRLYHSCGSATSDSSHAGSSDLAMLTHQEQGPPKRRGTISQQGDGQQPDMGGSPWVMRVGGVGDIEEEDLHKGFAVVWEVQAALSMAEGRSPAGGTLVRRRRHCPLGAPGMRSKLWCEESLARAALETKEEGKVKPQCSMLALL